MPRYFISLTGGSYVLTEDTTLHAIESTLAAAERGGDRFAHFIRPDQSIASVDPRNVVLIQLPVPSQTNTEKE